MFFRWLLIPNANWVRFDCHWHYKSLYVFSIYIFWINKEELVGVVGCLHLICICGWMSCSPILTVENISVSGPLSSHWFFSRIFFCQLFFHIDISVWAFLGSYGQAWYNYEQKTLQAWEMAQRIKHLLDNCGDWNLSPSYPCENSCGCDDPRVIPKFGR